MKTLKVWANGTALVPDYDAIEQKKLRFVGRKHDASIGHDVLDEKGNVVGKSGGWVPTLQPVTIKYRAEYVQELRAGNLLPADPETARIARVPFNPTQVLSY